jgi:hypothetical protein
MAVRQEKTLALTAAIAFVDLQFSHDGIAKLEQMTLPHQLPQRGSISTSAVAIHRCRWTRVNMKRS